MKPYLLQRRGYTLGTVEQNLLPICEPLCNHVHIKDWRAGKPIALSKLVLLALSGQTTHLTQSQRLYSAIINQQESDSLLLEEPYKSRIAKKFSSLGSAFNEGKPQEIETLFFDALDNGKIIAEDLWLKISWLSFYESDSSIRFRFSFGVDFAEDVASDQLRQGLAAELTEAVFPESTLITENETLIRFLRELLASETIEFVERIVYFNAKEGGAYLHHDHERGHAGVVYAQLTGRTYWLAIPEQWLVTEILEFIRLCTNDDRWPQSVTRPMQIELNKLSQSPTAVSEELNTFANSTLIHVINETEEFTQQLVQKGYGKLLTPGDLILLPQDAENNRCWHSVFCVGEESGQALSFAVRPS